MKIAILAAGYASRLGKNKALARVQGATLLERALCTVMPLASAGILVVVPPRCTSYAAVAAKWHARLVPNAARAQGLASSVRLAIRCAGSASALLLLPVDLARLDRRDLERLVRRWRAVPSKIVANDSGPYGGSPLILPRRYFALADSLTGDVGLRALLSQVRRDEVTRLVLPSASFDVDTPLELAAARRQWRRSGNSRSACTT